MNGNVYGLKELKWAGGEGGWVSGIIYLCQSLYPSPLPFVFMNIDKGKRRQKKNCEAEKVMLRRGSHRIILLSVGEGSREKKRKKVRFRFTALEKVCMVWEVLTEEVAAGFSFRAEKKKKKLFCLALNSALSIQHSFGVCFLRAFRLALIRVKPKWMSK